MAIRIYNTLTKKKEVFKPLQKDRVGIYVCGPTVYDSCHIGHARSVVVFDVVVRYFRMNNFNVNYVRNFTDVDDKIINRANESDTDTKSLSEKYIQEFYLDMDALKVKRADHEPKVTDHIDDIIAFVEKLMNNDAAYEAGGDVYFSVDAFADYGKLSGRSLDEMVAGSRVKVNELKKNPADFVLWKAAKPGEPFWESPWGKGRPGWHIECSAMSNRFLSETFDIHGGGKDLIFPHHENEIAQSEAANGKTFARYWMHNGFVNIDHEKMSKSLNNFLTVREILEQYHPEAVRLFLLSKHYRSPVDFTEQAMKESASNLDRIYACLERIEETAGSQQEDADSSEYWTRFCAAMDDDFNTAGALGVLFETVRDANRLMDGSLSDTAKTKARICGVVIKKMGGVLGMFQEDAKTFFENKKAQAAQGGTLDPALVDDLVAKRTQARKDKDWGTADSIRDQLTEMGIAIEDTPEGTIWKMA